MNERLRTVLIALYKEILARGESLELKVGGSSMWPFVRHGETLVLRKAAFKNILPGDIIAFVLGDRIICHRVFRKDSRYVRTKADALSGLDIKVLFTDVLGKVVALKRKGRIYKCDGWFAGWIGRGILWISFLWAPVVPLLRRFKAALIHSFL